MVKYDDDKEALAAEYVLGTLSSDERDQAETMLAIDPGFEAAVRQWERRLGELNVMVEAVEPRPEVWDRIKVGMHALAPPGAAPQETEVALPHVENVAPHVPEKSHEPQELEEPQPLEELEQPQELAEAQAPEPAATLDEFGKPGPEIEEAEVTENAPPTLSPLAALEASLFEPEAAPESGGEAETGAAAPLRVEQRPIVRGADAAILEHRVAHWRRMTAGAAVIAALLAVYVVLGRISPDLIPAPLRPEGAQMAAPTPGQVQQDDRLVAVLQQEPTAPAFLLTLDPRSRALTVRRVAATPEPGRSYQLWLIAKQFPGPRSLGVVGDSEFTQRALPANYDLDTLRTANYAVSLEPAGGSQSGVPTGPVLFTGKAVQSLPGTPPPT